MSRFYGIGIGVGDPEMMTLKAVKALKELDIIIVPDAGRDFESTAYSIAKDYLKPESTIINMEFSMNPDLKKRQEERKRNGKIVEDYLNSGKNVGFLTIGDPMTFSTYVYLLENVSEKHEVITVAGISSFADISSRFNLPLVMGNETLKIVPLHKNCDIKKEIENADNIVFMKTALKFKELREAVRETGNMDNILMVFESGKDKQKVYFNLDEIDAENVPYFSTMILKKGGVEKWKKYIS